jgi:hypothetical protein
MSAGVGALVIENIPNITENPLYILPEGKFDRQSIPEE